MRSPARPLLLVLICLVTPCLGSVSTGEPGPDRRQEPTREHELLQKRGISPQESFSRAWSQSQLEQVTTEVRAQLEALRGLSFKQDVRVVGVDPAIFDVLAQRAAALVARRVEPLAHPIAARLLGMAPGETDLEAEHKAAFAAIGVALYDHEDRACYVSEDAHVEDLPRALAAELARALDAQHFSSVVPEQANADAEFARRATRSGSGLELVTRWLEGTDDDDHQDREFAFWHAFDTIPLEALETLAPLVWRPAVAAYSQGQAFLRGQGRPTVLGDPAPLGDIDMALTHPPRSAEQVLHPSKYWNPDRVDEPRRVTWRATDLAAGWHVRHENTLGELGCALLTTLPSDRHEPAASQVGVIGLTFTNRAAAGWGGDRYLVLERAGGSLVCLATVWDTPRDAREFHAALSALAPGIRAAQVREAAAEGETSGLQIERVGEDRVLVTAWTGLGEDDVGSVVSALQLTVE